MGKQLTVRKTVLSDAILIKTLEEEAVVRAWLGELIGDQGEADALDLTDLIEADTWFMRDHNSTIVYITSNIDFPYQFELVGDTEIPTLPEAEFFFGEDKK